MKVCHVTSVHPLSDSRILEKESMSLAAGGHEVYLVGTGSYDENENIKIISVDNKKRGRLYRFFILDWKVIKEAEKLKCEVYHFHDPELLRFANHLQSKGYKVVFDSHEDVPRQIESKQWIPRKWRRIVAKIYEKREKKICKNIAGVITATDKISEVFKKHGIDTCTVHNYPVITDFNNDKVIREKRTLCFAGGLYEENGIKQLIDIVCELDDVTLKLAGKFEKSVEEYLKEKSCERIIYLGYLSRTEVEELYASSTIGIVADLPTGNNIEGLPIKLFEFMRAGLPIITTNFPLRKKIFEEFECGKLIDPFDYQTYKDTVLSMLGDVEYQKACGEQGKKAVREKYNWNLEKDKLLQFYCQI